MKQFFSILNFEFSYYLKNKVFVGVTIALMVVVAGLLCYPRVAGLFTSNETEPPKPTGDKEIIAIYDDVSSDPQLTLSVFQNAMADKDVKLVSDTSIDKLKEDVDAKTYDSAIIVNSPTSYSYIVKTISMYDSTTYVIDELMQTKYRLEELSKLGVDPTNAQELLSVTIKNEVIPTGKDQMQTFFYTYVLCFALYMAILLYGQLVATNVASEKSSRAMELLITSAKPVNLMFGKVIGSGLAGLLQLVAVFGSSYIFFNLNKEFWGGNDIINSIFNMPIEILLYTVLFFVLGFFIYAFLYGAIGSLASKVEDVNTSVLPLTFLFIAAFMVVIFAMSSGSVDSTLMKICSFVPFTSPMAMFARIAMGEVSAFEIIISIVILFISTVVIGYISAKIYQIGVLLYGKPPKLKNIIKAITAKQ